MIDNDDFVGLQIVGIQNRNFDIGADCILVLMSAPLVSPKARVKTNKKLLRDHVSLSKSMGNTNPHTSLSFGTKGFLVTIDHLSAFLFR